MSPSPDADIIDEYVTVLQHVLETDCEQVYRDAKQGNCEKLANDMLTATALTNLADVVLAPDNEDSAEFEVFEVFMKHMVGYWAALAATEDYMLDAEALKLFIKLMGNYRKLPMGKRTRLFMEAYNKSPVVNEMVSLRQQLYCVLLEEVEADTYTLPNFWHMIYAERQRVSALDARPPMVDRKRPRPSPERFHVKPPVKKRAKQVFNRFFTLDEEGREKFKKNIIREEELGRRKHMDGKKFFPVKLFFSKRNLFYAQGRMANMEDFSGAGIPKLCTVRSAYPSVELLKKHLLASGFRITNPDFDNSDFSNIKVQATN